MANKKGPLPDWFYDEAGKAETKKHARYIVGWAIREEARNARQDRRRWMDGGNLTICWCSDAATTRQSSPHPLHKSWVQDLGNGVTRQRLVQGGTTWFDILNKAWEATTDLELHDDEKEGEDTLLEEVRTAYQNQFYPQDSDNLLLRKGLCLQKPLHEYSALL